MSDTRKSDKKDNLKVDFEAFAEQIDKEFDSLFGPKADSAVAEKPVPRGSVQKTSAPPVKRDRTPEKGIKEQDLSLDFDIFAKEVDKGIDDLFSPGSDVVILEEERPSKTKKVPTSLPPKEAAPKKETEKEDLSLDFDIFSEEAGKGIDDLFGPGPGSDTTIPDEKLPREDIPKAAALAPGKEPVSGKKVGEPDLFPDFNDFTSELDKGIDDLFSPDSASVAVEEKTPSRAQKGTAPIPEKTPAVKASDDLSVDFDIFSSEVDKGIDDLFAPRPEPEAVVLEEGPPRAEREKDASPASDGEGDLIEGVLEEAESSGGFDLFGGEGKEMDDLLGPGPGTAAVEEPSPPDAMKKAEAVPLMVQETSPTEEVAGVEPPEEFDLFGREFDKGIDDLFAPEPGPVMKEEKTPKERPEKEEVLPRAETVSPEIVSEEPESSGEKGLFDEFDKGIDDLFAPEPGPVVLEEEAPQDAKAPALAVEEDRIEEESPKEASLDFDTFEQEMDKGIDDFFDQGPEPPAMEEGMPGKEADRFEEPFPGMEESPRKQVSGGREEAEEVPDEEEINLTVLDRSGEARKAEKAREVQEEAFYSDEDGVSEFREAEEQNPELAFQEQLQNRIESLRVAYLSLEWEFSSKNIADVQGNLGVLEEYSHSAKETALMYNMLKEALSYLKPDQPSTAASSSIMRFISDGIDLLELLLPAKEISDITVKQRLAELVRRFKAMRAEMAFAKAAPPPPVQPEPAAPPVKPQPVKVEAPPPEAPQEPKPAPPEAETPGNGHAPGSPSRPRPA